MDDYRAHQLFLLEKLETEIRLLTNEMNQLTSSLVRIRTALKYGEKTFYGYKSLFLQLNEQLKHQLIEYTTLETENKKLLQYVIEALPVPELGHTQTNSSSNTFDTCYESSEQSLPVT